MIRATIDQLQNRMNKQIEYSVRRIIDRDLIYAALKKQQISYKYLKLIQSAMRRH